MFINYRRLFNLRLHHGYYADGIPRGVDLIPDSQTLKKLKGGNMLLKNIPGGITVLYRAEEDGVSPLVALSELKLRFAISISDSVMFQTVTNLDESDSKKFLSSNILLFRNNPVNHSGDSDEPEKLNHTLIDSVESPLFTFSLKPEDPPGELYFRLENDMGEAVSPGKDADGNPLPDTVEISKLDDGSFNQQVDLRGRAAGIYTISVLESETDEDPLYVKKVFVDEELSGKNLQGILELTCGTESGDLYTEIQEYSLSFVRRESFWKYLIVNKYDKINETEELEIEDKGADDSEFYSPTGFSRLENEPGESFMVNGYETIRFRSADPIPFFEIPRPSVRLRNAGGIVFIKHLPNPSPSATPKMVDGQPESEIYVYI
jgi:hypothetical protein